MNPNVRASAGVSLAEVTASLALIALLLAVAVPNLLPAPELEVRVAARELVADMGLARQLAVSKGTTYVVEFRPPAGPCGPYTLYAVRRQGGPDEPDFPKALPAGVAASAPAQVPFKPSGAVGIVGPVSVDIILCSGPATSRVRVTLATGYARAVP